jgi:hypothetical protein
MSQFEVLSQLLPRAAKAQNISFKKIGVWAEI